MSGRPPGERSAQETPDPGWSGNTLQHAIHHESKVPERVVPG